MTMLDRVPAGDDRGPHAQSVHRGAGDVDDVKGGHRRDADQLRGCAADDVGMLEMGVDDVDTLLAQQRRQAPYYGGIVTARVHFMDSPRPSSRSCGTTRLSCPGVGGGVGQADHHESEPSRGGDPGQFHEQRLGPAGAE